MNRILWNLFPTLALVGFSSCGSNDVDVSNPNSKRLDESGSAAIEEVKEKPYRVGMSWLVKEDGPFLSYEKIEVKSVDDEKVTWWKTKR